MAKAAKKAASKAKGAKKPAAKEVKIRPINEKFTKSGLAKHLSAESGVDTRSVKSVLGALEATMYGCLHKKGAGQFTLPVCCASSPRLWLPSRVARARIRSPARSAGSKPSPLPCVFVRVR